MTTLADLDAHIVAFPGAMAKHHRHAARKALARVAQASGQSAAMMPAGDVVADHAVLKPNLGREWYDEHSALQRLLELPRLPADLTTRIRTGVATIADVKAMVELQEWGDERVRIRTAFDRLASKLFERRAIALDDLLATETVIEPVLRELTHLDFSLQPAAWSTMKSRIRRAIRLVDIHARTRLSASLLSGRWSTLITTAKSDRSLAGTLAKLWPLVDYCHRLAIEPEAICDATVAALRDDLEARGRKDPFAVARDVVYAWERLQSRIDGWPPTPLTRLYRPGGKRPPRAMEIDDLPPTLLAEWEAFVAQHGRIDGHMQPSLVDCVADDDDFESLLAGGNPVVGTFSMASIRNLRTALVDLANATLTKGLAPNSFANITTVEVVRAAVAAFFKRREAATGHKPALKSGTATQIVSRAITLARFGDASPQTIAALSDLRDKVDPRLISRRSDGSRQYHEHRIGERHRKRLAAFNDPTYMWAWFELPHELAVRMDAIAKAGGPTTLEEIGDGIVAVLYAITLCAPLRRSNLAQLTIAGPDANIWLPPTGKGPGKLRVPSAQVKNRTELHGELDSHAVRVLGVWVRMYRPILARMVGASPNNPYLFPAHGMGHRSRELLNKGFVSRNLKAGYELNLHCQRHMCAKAILDQDPRQMELVRQLLGHRNIKTTERYYAEINAVLVQRIAHRLMEERRRAIYGALPRALV